MEVVDSQSLRQRLSNMFRASLDFAPHFNSNSLKARQNFCIDQLLWWENTYKIELIELLPYSCKYSYSGHMID